MNACFVKCNGEIKIVLILKSNPKSGLRRNFEWQKLLLSSQPPCLILQPQSYFATLFRKLENSTTQRPQKPPWVYSP